MVNILENDSKPKVIIEKVKEKPNDSEKYFKSVEESVKKIFDSFGGAKNLLKPNKDVYIKPNGIDLKAHAHTRPEVLEAIVKYFFEGGVRNIYIFENSTQSNYTRIVFEAVGYHDVCKRTGAKPIYLDEEKTVEFTFNYNEKKQNSESDNYDLKTFQMSETVVEKLIKQKVQNLYIDVPKLKTHSMSGVTLGIKNQWAFPRHFDRKFDHNYNLHKKLIHVLEYIRPDFTLIEGIEGTIHGHYPATKLADKLVKPFGILIGGTNVVATDLVGARIFGLTPDDVPHLKIAIESGLGNGVKSLEDIDIQGDLSEYTEKYPTDLYPLFPPDVNIVEGKELACKEGCKNNPFTLMQILYVDYGGKGRYDLIIGKGHDVNIIDSLKGPVLIAGHCAIDEVSERLIKRLGRKNVYMSDGCNNLAQTAAAMFRLMHVSPLKMVTLNPLKSIKLLAQAKFHGSKANVPSIFSNIIKMV